MDIGATLRSARERRRLSLDQLSRVTKISTTALGALEHNELHKLPPPIFARGFVRAYAREVGLDVEEMVREFSAQLEPHPDDVGGADQGERIDASDRVGDVEGQDQWHRGVLVRLLSLSLVLAVVGVLFGAYRGSPTSPGGGEAVAQSSRGGRATPADPPPSAAGTTGVQEARLTDAVRREGLHITVAALESCWMSVTVDGTTVARTLMGKGERHSFDAHDEVVMRVGNPAAFTYRINDRPGRSLGAEAEAITVRITPDNYREFVAPARR